MRACTESSWPSRATPESKVFTSSIRVPRRIALRGRLGRAASRRCERTSFESTNSKGSTLASARIRPSSNFGKRSLVALPVGASELLLDQRHLSRPRLLVPGQEKREDERARLGRRARRTAHALRDRGEEGGRILDVLGRRVSQFVNDAFRCHADRCARRRTRKPTHHAPDRLDVDGLSCRGGLDRRRLGRDPLEFILLEGGIDGADPLDERRVGR
jgi:hypothetical protein